MTLKALFDLTENGTLQVPVIGVGRNDWGDEDLRKHARESVKAIAKEKDEALDEGVLEKYLGNLTYVQGDYTDDETYKSLKKAISSAKHPVFYLEIPPSLFADVIDHLAGADLTEDARVVIEKPFGHDLQSAIELNDRIHKVLDEDQIYRIDHFLGKEPVMDITYFRFANTLPVPIWTRSAMRSSISSRRSRTRTRTATSAGSTRAIWTSRASSRTRPPRPL